MNVGSTGVGGMVAFNRPALLGNEFIYMREALESAHLSGDGAFTRRCHAILEEIVGAPKSLLTTSCTHALEMAALLLDIKAGDEVIVPSFTFISTINAFVLRGAKPVFVDVRADTLNLDESLIEQFITPRTRAIVPVHYAGVGCEMTRILAIAEAHGLAVVEDNAHGLFGRFRGRNLGTFGSLATLSFHETKNISCGEGGALLINDETLVQRAEIIREKGSNRSRFFRGQVDKYTWVDIGSSYLPSDMLAAFLCAQLEKRDVIQTRRMQIWQRYDRELRDWGVANGVQLPTVPEHCEHPAHLYYLILPSLETRQRMIDELSRQGVSAVFHYQPLHLSDMGRQFGGRDGDCPVTEIAGDRLLRLPLFFGLSDEEQEMVIQSVLAFQP